MVLLNQTIAVSALTLPPALLNGCQTTTTGGLQAINAVLSAVMPLYEAAPKHG